MTENNRITQTMGKIYDIANQINALTTQRTQLLDSIKKGIQRGETSGDVITNACICWFGRWDDEIKEPFEELQSSVRQWKARHPVLVVKKQVSQEEILKYRIQSESGLMPPPKLTTTKYHLQYGKISGELEFNIPKIQITIPTKKHLTLEGKAMEGCCPAEKWQVQECPITNNLIELPHLWQKQAYPKGSYAPLGSDPLATQESGIYFCGREGISTFFETLLQGRECYDKAKELLSQIDSKD